MKTVTKEPAAVTAPLSPIERLPVEWEALLENWKQPRYRATQVFRWIHQRGVVETEQMTNLPQALRTELRDAGLGACASLMDTRVSSDGTKKLLIGLTDGYRVESVLIPQSALPEGDDEPDAAEDDRDVTQCISSQVGCAMGCRFCASGQAGLKRQMSAAEIISQVLIGRRTLGPSKRLHGIVLMGMGEPLHNYQAVARALTLLSHPDGIGVSTRRLTLSTCGLVPQIERLGRDFGGRVQLAVSLHASDDQTRSRLMPINRTYPLSELVAALKRYPMPRRRRITIEYTLIRGINDSIEAARALVELLSGVPVKVNLIALNPVPQTKQNCDDSEYQAPDPQAVFRFQEELIQADMSAFIRQPRGQDIAAACGQLALGIGSKPADVGCQGDVVG
jgi:23S rRNA (adenine2503-C2)-methyltransferase